MGSSAGSRRPSQPGATLAERARRGDAYLPRVGGSLWREVRHVLAPRLHQHPECSGRPAVGTLPQPDERRHHAGLGSRNPSCTNISQTIGNAPRAALARELTIPAAEAVGRQQCVARGASPQDPHVLLEGRHHRELPVPGPAVSAGATAAAGGVGLPIEFVTGEEKVAVRADPEDAGAPSLGASWARPQVGRFPRSPRDRRRSRPSSASCVNRICWVPPIHHAVPRSPSRSGTHALREGARLGGKPPRLTHAPIQPPVRRVLGTAPSCVPAEPRRPTRRPARQSTYR